MQRDSILKKGFILIESLATLGSSSLERLNQESKISKSSIYRILCELENLGYVSRYKNIVEDIWKLNLKFVNISSYLLSRLEIKTEIRDILTRLVDDTKEIVQLYILHEQKVMVLDNIKKYSSLVSVPNVGALLDINICAAGLVLAAYMDESELNLLLNNNKFKKHTEFTITDKIKLKDELKKVRARGYSVDDQFFAIGHRCIGAPIFDYTDKAIAAVNISGHIKTISDDKIIKLSERVKTAAMEASVRLGYLK